MRRQHVTLLPRIHRYSKFWFVSLVALILLLATIGGMLWSVSIRWKFVGAARDGDIDTVRAMLDKGMEPDTISHLGGVRAISMAAYRGHIEIVRLLLDRGANPTYGLPQAVLMHRIEIVRLLVARGADVQHWQGYQMSPLQFARDHGDAVVVRLLCAAGAR